MPVLVLSVQWVPILTHPPHGLSPDIKRGTADIGLCKSVKITNISETSWFDNSIFMQDVTASGGLLVDQYTYNWAPSATVKAPAKELMKTV
mgnify:CR=1 FL=1